MPKENDKDAEDLPYSGWGRPPGRDESADMSVNSRAAEIFSRRLMFRRNLSSPLLLSKLISTINSGVTGRFLLSFSSISCLERTRK